MCLQHLCLRCIGQPGGERIPPFSIGTNLDIIARFGIKSEMHLLDLFLCLSLDKMALYRPVPGDIPYDQQDTISNG